MAKRSVRRRRRQEEFNRENPDQPVECVAEDCTAPSTTLVEIDGGTYRVCDTHAELVQIQTLRRNEHRRQREAIKGPERRRQTEEALGLR